MKNIIKEKFKIFKKEYGEIFASFFCFCVCWFWVPFLDASFKRIISIYVAETIFLIILVLFLTSSKVLKYLNYDEKRGILESFKKENIIEISIILMIDVWFIVSFVVNGGLKGFLVSISLNIFIIIVYILYKKVREIKEEKERKEKSKFYRQYMEKELEEKKQRKENKLYNKYMCLKEENRELDYLKYHLKCKIEKKIL